MYPTKGWSSYEVGIKLLGERRPLDDLEKLQFLESLGLASGGTLSESGQIYFEARFIDDEVVIAKEVLRVGLLERCPQAAAIAQSLAKRQAASRTVIETLLRNQGHGDALTDRRLGSLLALMSWSGVIDYAKREGRIRVLVNPIAEEPIPQSIFIAPHTPWTNRKRLEQILATADEYLYWFDKHFLPPGLDCLGAAIDGGVVRRVRVLSLGLDESKSKRARRSYRDLGRELKGRGTDFEWRFIDSEHVRDTHDRWIMSASRAWNVPNLNAILSGQHSEISESTNRRQVCDMFERLWSSAPRRPFEASS